MAQPKIGPRGVTIDDVQDVATNGLRQTGAATYKSVSQPTATTPIDYAALLAGGPAPTYGQKYGGQPSAEYGKQMILGAAMQAKSVGELAALQAATNRSQLESKFASDLLSGTNKLYPTYRAQFSKPLVDESTMTRNYRPSGMDQTAAAIADQERKLNSMYVYDFNGTRRLAMNSDPLEAQALQASINENKQALSRAGYDPTTANRSQEEAIRQTAINKQNAYDAYMNRMNMLDLTQPGSQPGTFTNLDVNRANRSFQGSPTVGQLLYKGATRQTAADLTPGLEAALAEQVTPYETVAKDFANIPLSQYAQQIAVNRYGYDPALAAGLFDTSVDVQSLKDQADLFAAQNPQLNMSPAEIVFNQFGEEGLNTYLQQQAEQALFGTGSQQRTEEQLAQDAANAPIDAELYSVYATAPSEVNSALNADVARQYMSDPNFLAQFQAGTTKIYDAMSQGVSGADAVNSYVQNYLNETGDPVTARILEELLSNISFG